MTLTEIVPSKGKKPMKLIYTRLYFRKQKNRRGEDCYIAKVKEYVTKEGVKHHSGDIVVIGNIRGTNKCPIDQDGRWDVVCKKMDEPATGLVVVSATRTVDRARIELDPRNFCVNVLINDKEEKLKTEDGKFIGLNYGAKFSGVPEKIAENIKQKLGYLQMPEDFFTDLFVAEFIQCCNNMREAYVSYVKKPENTKATGIPKLDTELARLRAKFNQRG